MTTFEESQPELSEKTTKPNKQHFFVGSLPLQPAINTGAASQKANKIRTLKLLLSPVLALPTATQDKMDEPTNLKLRGSAPSICPQECSRVEHGRLIPVIGHRSSNCLWCFYCFPTVLTADTCMVRSHIITSFLLVFFFLMSLVQHGSFFSQCLDII